MNFQNNNLEEMTQLMQKYEKKSGNLARVLNELPIFSQWRVIENQLSIKLNTQKESLKKYSKKVNNYNV